MEIATLAPLAAAMEEATVGGLQVGVVMAEIMAMNNHQKWTEKLKTQVPLEAVLAEEGTVKGHRMENQTPTLPLRLGLALLLG